MNKSHKTKLIIAIAVIVLAFYSNITALGYNEDRLRYDQWTSNPNAVNISIDEDTIGKTLHGTISYYIDYKNNCAYFRSTLQQPDIISNDSVSYLFEIETPDESYRLYAKEQGIVNTTSTTKALFNVGTQFSTISSQHTGVYSIAMDIKTKTEYTIINTSIIINETKYPIVNNIMLVKPTSTKTTTTKVNSSKEELGEEYIAPACTPAIEQQLTTEKDKNSKAKKVNTTKFKGTGVYQSTTKFKGSNDEQTAEADAVNIPYSTNVQSKRIKQSKGLAVLACVIGGVGLAIIIFSLIKRKEESEDKEDIVDTDDFDF